MSNKMLYGKRLNSYEDIDIDDILNKLTPEEIDELNNDLDPDNTLLPPSERCKNQTDKQPTGEFDREALLKFLEDKAKSEKDWEKNVPFVKEIRGKVYERKKSEVNFSKKDLDAMGFEPDIETEFDDVLNGATEEELVQLAAILGFTGMLNQVQYNASYLGQSVGDGGFKQVARCELLKVIKDEPDNNTNLEEVIDKLKANDGSLQKVNLNNMRGIKSQQFADLFEALANNTTLRELHCANVNLTNKVVSEHLIPALEKNTKLAVLNVESNYLAGDAVIKLFEVLTSDSCNVHEVRIANQAQKVLGVRVEQSITNLIRKSQKIQVVGIDLETRDARNKIADHLSANVDNHTRVQRQAG